MTAKTIITEAAFERMRTTQSDSLCPFTYSDTGTESLIQSREASDEPCACDMYPYCACGRKEPVMDIRDPNGRLADLARHVLGELNAIEADYLYRAGEHVSLNGHGLPPSEVLGRTQLIGTEPHVTNLRDAAANLARRLDGYTERPDARAVRIHA